MRVLTSGKKIGAEVPMSFFHFDRFEGKGGDFFFIDSRINFKGLAEIQKTERKIVYFDIEEPNRFCSADPEFRREAYESMFYKILSVCPYTTEWLNKEQGGERRRFVFFPFDEKIFPAPTEKKYDVIYFGGLHARELVRMVKTISKFNYRFVAPDENKTYGIHRFRSVYKAKKMLGVLGREHYLTDKNVSNKEKLDLVSKSKVTIVHNALFIDPFIAKHVQNTPDFRGNKAFDLIPDKGLFRTIWDILTGAEYLVPQQKTRLFEAAFCRSLILCRKDPFNVVERFFAPGKEFVYYEEGKLEETLKDILEHYEDYQQVIENAYARATRDYTTGVFFEKYLKTLV